MDSALRRGHRPAHKRSRRTASDAGASSVELVITMPALLLAILTVLQFGLWMHAQHLAQAAAQEGAAVARADGGSSQAAHDRTTASLAELGPTILRDTDVAVERTPTDVTVTVTGHATSILGLFSFPIREKAHGPVERFTPNDRGFTISDGSSGDNRSVGAR